MTDPNGNVIAEQEGTAPDTYQEKEISRAVAHLFMHKSWRERQIDHWSYVGDAQWARRISFDISVPKAYREMLCDRENKFWLIPLFEVPKGTTFSSLDLRSQANRALKLKHGSVSSLMIVTALVGALEEIRYARPDEPSLSSKYALRSFLYDLFDSTLPLQDEDGVTLNPLSEDYAKRTKCAVVRRVRRLKELNETAKEIFGWDKTDLDALEKDFVFMFDQSRLFRWFILNYTYNELFCVMLSEPETIIKCSYQSGMDLFGRGGMHHSGSPFCYFNVSLDFILTSEVGAITIDAPEGMIFIPNFNPHHNGQRGGRLDELREAIAVSSTNSMSKAFSKRWLQITDRAPNSLDGGNATLVGVGSLNPAYANFRGIRSLWIAGDGENKVEPLHRIPVNEESGSHLLSLELMMIPVFGTRITRYFIVLMMCLALFGIDMLCAGKQTSINVQTVTSLIPMATLVTASMDGAGYIRREALKIPTYLTHGTVLIAVPLLLWFSVANVNEQNDLAYNIAVGGFVGTCAVLLLVSIWFYLVWSIKRSWNKQEDSYGSFPVGVRAFDEHGKLARKTKASL